MPFLAWTQDLRQGKTFFNSMTAENSLRFILTMLTLQLRRLKMCFSAAAAVMKMGRLQE